VTGCQRATIHRGDHARHQRSSLEHGLPNVEYDHAWLIIQLETA
jgi:hypothetical protein